MNLHPNRPRAKKAILADILAIDNPIAGTLTTTIRTLKNGTSSPHYHLQLWKNGKNHTTYVPTDKVEQVKQGIEQHKKLRALAEELEQAGVQAVLLGKPEAASGDDDVKKKSAFSKSSKPNRKKPPKSPSQPSPK